MTDPTLLFIAALALLSSAAGWVLFFFQLRVSNGWKRIAELRQRDAADWKALARSYVKRIAALAAELCRERRENGDEWKQEDI